MYIYIYEIHICTHSDLRICSYIFMHVCFSVSYMYQFQDPHSRGMINVIMFHMYLYSTALSARVYGKMYVYIYTCVYIYIYTYAYAYAHVYVYICICVYV